MASNITELLGASLPALKILDVGAMSLGVETVYDALLDLPGVRVVGFEPNPVECEKLKDVSPASHRYLPHFIGDGSRRTFHWCSWAATSSLYRPNTKLLKRFTNLPELVEVVETSAVQTTRLDDVAEARESDFVKIDVQGATLDVLRGGPEVIGTAVVVQCEAEFVPLYEGEPLFAEIDQEMRRLGFLFHQFAGISGRTFAPLRRKGTAASSGQLLWTDAVYVRSFLDLSSLQPASLLKLALIVERLYGSRDLALLALQHFDEKTGGDLWERYVRGLTGSPKDKPPL